MTTTQDAPPADLELAVQAARAAVIDERATLEIWEEKRDQARADLAELEKSAGEQILADPDPDAAEQIESHLTTLRSVVRAAERAIAAQHPRLLRAEIHYLIAEADAHEPAVAACDVALKRHTRKTDRLLKELEDHEAVFVPEARYIAALPTDSRIGMGTKDAKSRPLVKALFVARAHVAVLRHMAAGGDPMELLGTREWQVPAYFYYGEDPDLFPNCVQGTDALVPHSGYVRRIDGIRQQIRDLEQAASDLPMEIEDWTQRLKEPDPVSGRPFSEEILLRRHVRLAELPGELAELRATLAELTGEAVEPGGVA